MIESAVSVFAIGGSLIWVILLLLPWRPWSTHPRLEADPRQRCEDISRQLTVLIPARDEADTIVTTLQGLSAQSDWLPVVLVDDESEDATAAVAAAMAPENIDLQIVHGQPPPSGWNGKLWALQQGLDRVQTPWVLQLDADIELRPGLLKALLDHAEQKQLDLVSVMARLNMQSRWEKLLLPAFIFFFRLLYPFHLSNRPGHFVAAAAGGCILVKRAALQKISAYDCIHETLIGDCALARRIKARGFLTWIGLSRGVSSHRRYLGLGEISQMISRSAYCQLRYSPLLLLLCSLLLMMACWGPLAGALVSDSLHRGMALMGIICAAVIYVPLLSYYGRSPGWAFAMPVIGSLYLWMTWQSAWKHWSGSGSQWKSRNYRRT